MVRQRTFTLRSLLLFIVLFAGALSWISFARRERHAISSLRQAGAFIALANHANKGPRRNGFRGLFDARPATFVSSVSSDDAASYLPNLKQLESVALGGSDVTDTGLAHVAPLKSLTALAVVCPNVTDAGLRHFDELSNLRSLSLARTRVTDEGLQHISRLDRLEDLSLAHTEITDDGLQHVVGLLKIKSLSLRGTSVTDRGLTELSNLTQIENLVIEDTDVTLAGVGHLIMELQQRDLAAALGVLRHEYTTLELSGPPNVRLVGLQVTDAFLPYVARGAIDVRGLMLNVDDITGDGLKHLGALNRMESLGLHGLDDHEVPWKQFAGCAALRHVSLSGRQLTNRIVRDIGHLPNLEGLALKFDEVGSGKFLSEISQLPKLKYLRLNMTPFVAGFGELRSLTRLERLYLERTATTGKGLAALAGLGAFNSLRLGGSPVDDEGLSDVGQLTQLIELRLNDTGVTDQGLRYLTGLTKLTKLDLRETTITSQGIESLANLRNLEELDLSGTAVSDGAVVFLQQLQTLQVLYLSDTGLTESGIVQLEAALPKCQIGFEEFNRRVMR